MIGRKTSTAKPAAREMSQGQLAYETKRAAEAGLSLDAWLARKARAASVPAVKTEPAAKAKRGLVGRLLDRAHKPI